MNTSKPSSISLYILVALIAFQAVSGIYGGAALVLDPTGSTLQMPISLLEGSPFSDYLLPGIILFSVLGIFPAIVCYGLLRKMEWAWLGTLVVGIALVIWIGVEVAMVGYHSEPPLQFIYGVLGVIILIFIQLPSVQLALKYPD